MFMGGGGEYDRVIGRRWLVQVLIGIRERDELVARRWGYDRLIERDP
jgi:hypothetical protein